MVIAGRGSGEKELRDLVLNLNLSEETEFVGFVDYKDVAKYHRLNDIFVCVSRQESFGVAVLEASSCGKPVIVSNTGGLPEVVENNTTGIIVKSESVEETAQAIEKLVLDKELREQMGKNGREFVLRNYELSFCLDKMTSIYSKTIKKGTTRNS